MVLLSKEEISEELTAIDESILAHEAQIAIHEKMLKREIFLKELVEKEKQKK